MAEPTQPRPLPPEALGFEKIAYEKQQLNFWRDLAWPQTVNHARDRLALSMHSTEAQDAVNRFFGREK